MHLRRAAPTLERIDDAAEADERVLEHLANLGCVPDEPRETTHFVYLRRRDGAAAVASALASEGWVTSLERCEDESWLVVATRVTTLTLQLVRATRRLLEALAAAHGGVYDGWEVKAG